jgi:drug/metabolite transporter (DMT)-like permease
MATSTIPRFRVVFGLISFGVVAGSAFMFVKLLVGEISPLQLVAGRVALGALALMAMMTAMGQAPAISWRLLRGAGVLALLDTIGPYLLIAWAQQYVTSSTAALLVSTMPLFTTILAIRTREESPAAGSIAGLAIGFVGVAILGGPETLDVGSEAAVGVVAVVVAAVGYAAGAVYSRSLTALADPIGLSAVKLGIASLLLLPATALIEGVGAYASLSGEGWLGLLAIGCVSTGIGRSIYQWVIVKAGSVRASLVTYIVPAVALLLSWSVLGEPIRESTLAGGVLVLTGIAAVMYGPQLAARLRERQTAPLIDERPCSPVTRREGNATPHPAA